MQRALQHGSGIRQTEWLPALFVLMQNPLNGAEVGPQLVSRLVQVIAGLSPQSQKARKPRASGLLGGIVCNVQRASMAGTCCHASSASTVLRLTRLG